jgi:putative flavoprotein involved in K+ transport
MASEKVSTLVIGAGQAGIAASEHLSALGEPHLVLERSRIAERWRSERWDSLVQNGPVWHDRFPNMEFKGFGPDEFAGKEAVADYFVEYAKMIDAPVRCGVEVRRAELKPGGGFIVETSQGTIEADNLIAATGPFQKPLIPEAVPEDAGVMQIHSSGYRNPQQLPDGAVLVVGAGSSGAQIAEELARSGRKVYLSVGPHDRPPRRYRGKDFVWWLGQLGKWDMETPDPSMEHVTIAVSGAYGGHTMDFRNLAAQGVTLLGRTGAYQNGKLRVANDLEHNITAGDGYYLSLLEQADAHAEASGLDLPEESEAKELGPLPDCVTSPVLSLDLAEAGITSIIWATGFAVDFSWLKVGDFDSKGRPAHHRGVSPVPGLYFLGLPWLSRRASSFIWGVWHDAGHVAGHIAAQRKLSRSA